MTAQVSTHFSPLQLLCSVDSALEHRMRREHASVTVCVCFYLCFLQVSGDVTEAEANYQTPNGWYLVHYAAYLGVSLPALYCRQMFGSGSV